MQPEQNNTQEKSLDYGVKVLAVIGVLAMLTLGSFLTITAAKYLPGALRYMATAAVSLTSIFYQKERLVLSVDTLTPLSGKPVKVTIEHRGRAKEGAYTLTYPCLTGVTVETKFGTGTCAVPLTIALENNTVTITPVSKKNRYVDVPVTISFIPAGSLVESITESVTLTVTNNDIGTPVVTPANETTGNGTPTYHTPGTPSSNSYSYPVTSGTTQQTDNPNGTADLKVVLIDTGIIDANNNFIATSTLRRSDKIGIRFSVQNIGTKHSTQWNFNAILPTSPGYVYNSDTQPAIYPGDRVEYTLGFDRALEGNLNVKIEIDGGNLVPELNENNNTLDVPLKVL